jgi:hypothetical protein|tara:strand:- start:810 stop:1127 length:318 start_codon:yes stop_codon:yes gene_type:complete
LTELANHDERQRLLSLRYVPEPFIFIPDGPEHFLVAPKHITNGACSAPHPQLLRLHATDLPAFLTASFTEREAANKAARTRTTPAIDFASLNFSLTELDLIDIKL